MFVARHAELCVYVKNEVLGILDSIRMKSSAMLS